MDKRIGLCADNDDELVETLIWNAKSRIEEPLKSKAKNKRGRGKSKRKKSK